MSITRSGAEVEVKAAPGGPSPAKNIPFLAVAILGGGALAIVLAILLARGGAPPHGTPPAGGTPVETTATPAPAAPVASPAATEPPAVVPTVVELSAVPEASAPVSGSPGSPTAAPAASLLPPSVAPPLPAATPTPPLVETYVCRESAVFNVSPEEALVTVDGQTIGTADDWDDAGGGKKYRFRSPGPHYVRLSLEKHVTTWIRIDVRPNAEEKTANVDLELKRLKHKDD